VEVLINGRMFGRGQGKAKKEAEQQAAMKALEKIRNEHQITSTK